VPQFEDFLRIAAPQAIVALKAHLAHASFPFRCFITKFAHIGSRIRRKIPFSWRPAYTGKERSRLQNRLLPSHLFRNGREMDGALGRHLRMGHGV
jgi:hypothetical protein